MQRNFKLTLEYAGGGFAGWQVQAGGQRTVQGELQQALARLSTGPPRLMGAGRTDAGVHAEGQVASARMQCALSPAELQRALNAILPPDIAVLHCAPAPRDFDARRCAASKHYRYLIWNAPLRSPLRAQRMLHLPAPLNLPALQQAAAALQGRHDFSSFQGAGSEAPHALRTLHRLAVAGEAGGAVQLDFHGDGFLRHMVRNIVGTLVEVGRGRRAADSMPRLLALRARAAAGPTAAAHGLTLMAVHYPPAASTQTGP